MTIKQIATATHFNVSLIAPPRISARKLDLNEITKYQSGTFLGVLPNWGIFLNPIGFVLFFISMMAETKRAPFDLPESESELVAGYLTEYSGMKFGMFFVGEYLGLVLISSLITVLFFGGWLGPGFLPPIVWFALKAFFFIVFFILLRAAIPRPRYDQLMRYGWLFLLPLSLANLLVTGALILMGNGG